MNMCIINGSADTVYRMFSKDYLNKRKEFYKNNIERVEKNIEVLQDETSKDTYKSMIYYRVTRKRKEFPKNKDIGNQYFTDDIIKMSNNECFVDCGAYNGDTIKKFLAKCNNKYDNIVAFEPDNDNFQVLKENYQSPSVYVYNSGVWSTNTVLKFSSNNNVSSNFNENGEEEVKVVALDNIPQCQNATFIKMDIEGSELEALKGADKIIRRVHPKLAICIYHSDNDMIDIIEYIRNNYPDYKIYVRHHSIIEDETVMYCI